MVSRLVCVFSLVLFLASCSSSESSSSAASEEVEIRDTFTISGSVQIDLDSAVDSDVEARVNSNFTTTNNSPSSAQPITNPVVLGGYVSGSEGRYSTRGQSNDNLDFLVDSSDFFIVSLSENQQVSLSVFYADAEHEANGENPQNLDIDLALFTVNDTTAAIAEVTLNQEEAQSLQAPADGEYIIAVQAAINSAPTLYTLSVSPLVAGPTHNVANLNANFKPGHVLVKFREAEPESSVPGDSRASAASFAASNASSIAPSVSGLKHRRKMGKQTHLFTLDQAQTSGVGALAMDSDDLGVSAVMEKKLQTLQLIESLRQRDDVVYAEPDYYLQASALIEDPSDILDSQYSRQWNMEMINAAAAWRVSSGRYLNENDIYVPIRIAVIDTGIHAVHEDLDKDEYLGLVDGYDFVSDVNNDGDSFPGRDNDPNDESANHHGSHVAGIIAAEANNTGVRGVAYDAAIMPLRALGENGFGLTSDIVSAILYAAGEVDPEAGQAGHAADIINLSLGSSDPSETFRESIELALAKGIIVVAAAGNSGQAVLEYPAAYSGVIGVGAVTPDYAHALYSNRGSFIDVAAPGGRSQNQSHVVDGDGVLSTSDWGLGVDTDDYYQELHGTSMAAPHVSGVAALMKALDPTMDNLAFQSFIDSGDITDDLFEDRPNPYTVDEYRDRFGAGLINALKAVEMVNGDTPIEDALLWFPSTFRFSGNDSHASLLLSNPGKAGHVFVERVGFSENETAPDWAFISEFPDGVDQSTGLGRYEVEIDRSQLLEDTLYSTEIHITYRINGVLETPVVVDLFASKTTQGDDTVGNLQVFLLENTAVEEADPGQNASIFRIIGGVLEEGVYHFEFNNVPPGEYYLQASTDNDGDYRFMDQGEAQGVYPEVNNPSVLSVVDDDISGVEFTAGYQTHSGNNAESTPLVMAPEVQ